MTGGNISRYDLTPIPTSLPLAKVLGLREKHNVCVGVLKATGLAKFRSGFCLCNFPCVFNYLQGYIIYIRLELGLLALNKQE